MTSSNRISNDRLILRAIYSKTIQVIHRYDIFFLHYPIVDSFYLCLLLNKSRCADCFRILEIGDNYSFYRLLGRYTRSMRHDQFNDSGFSANLYLMADFKLSKTDVLVSTAAAGNLSRYSDNLKRIWRRLFGVVILNLISSLTTEYNSYSLFNPIGID
jgi:hypothetical protein